MAKIYGTLSSKPSEKKVRTYLDKYLNDDWIIYHNFVLDKNFNDGEVDFLILHKTLGGIVLEVKGGGIETSLSKNGNYNWFSIDRNNQKYEIKNPYQQSHDQANKLRRYVGDLKTIGYKFNFVNAAAFPDIDKVDFDSTDMNNLNTFPRLRFNENLSQNFKKLIQNVKQPTHSEKILNQLHSYILPVFTTNQTLQSSFDLMEEEFQTITEEQFKTMEELEDNPKFFIQGPAGTGKTLIAINFVKRMVANNKNVLFVCMTNALGTYLRSQFKETDNIYVGNIHSVLKEVKNEVLSKFKAKKNEELDSYDSEKLKWESEVDIPGFEKQIEFDIENLYKLFEMLNKKIDCVVIDECQDFKYNWQEGLQMISLYQEDSKFFIFGDPNQSASKDTWKPLFDQPVRKLKKNLRNSNEINAFVNDIFNIEAENSGVTDGLNVNQFVLTGDLKNQQKQTEKELPKILFGLKEDGIDFSDIAILGLKESHIKFIKSIKALGKEIEDIENLLVDSSLRYKGLEKDVIIAVYPDFPTDAKTRLHSQIYTGVTRPKKLLYLLIGEDSLKLIKEQN